MGVIDSSGWQYKYAGNGKLHPDAQFPDFGKAADLGVVGIIHRIGNGTALDHSFNRTYDAAKEAGLKIGAYYYAQPGRMSVANSVAKVKGWLDGYDLDLPHMLDLEEYYGTPLSKTTLGLWVNGYMTGMMESGEHPAILYAGAAFANSNTITDVSYWDTIQPRYYKYGERPESHVATWPGFIRWDRQPRETPVLGPWNGYQFTSDLLAQDFGFPNDGTTRLDGNLVRLADWEDWTKADVIPPPVTPPIIPPTPKEYNMKLVTPHRVLDERATGKPGKLHRAQVVPEGSDVTVAKVSIAIVAEKHGYLSDRVGTSFCNYSEGRGSVVLDMPVQPDGTIIFGSTSDAYVIVDVRGEGK